MASTVLQQVLENVENGVLLPLRGRLPEPTELDRVREALLAELDASLDQLVDRVSSILVKPGLTPSDRQVTLDGFGDLLRQELSQLGSGQEASELAEQVGDLRELTSTLKGALASGGDPRPAPQDRSGEILARLQTISEQIRHLAVAPAAPATATDGSEEHAAPVAEPDLRVPFDDIQSMIEFLK